MIYKLVEDGSSHGQATWRDERGKIRREVSTGKRNNAGSVRYFPKIDTAA